MRKTEYCIWDFNGTILDDVDAGIKSVNKLLADRGLPTLKDRADYHKYFRFPIKDYYRSLGFDFRCESYETLAPIWVEQYLINVKEAPLREGVIETLESLKAVGIKQIVLSATELEMLKGQLASLGISDYFCQVWGLDNIHAASKVELAKEWRRHVGEAKAWLIGDTVHDAETAKAIGAECLLVEGGHQPRATLETVGVSVFDSLLRARDHIISSK